jgi:hypothetical protein
VIMNKVLMAVAVLVLLAFITNIMLGLIGSCS